MTRLICNPLVRERWPRLKNREFRAECEQRFEFFASGSTKPSSRELVTGGGFVASLQLFAFGERCNQFPPPFFSPVETRASH